MLYFANDYTEGACKEILNALIKTNDEKLSGYGTDKYSASAKEKIKKACKNDNIDIYFLTGGTQTNAVVIAALLKSYEGVIAVETGRINVHESGAIEMTGHKVLTLPHHKGKMNADELKEYIKTFYNDQNREHMVYPGMVCISHPTEYGTLYTREELLKINEVCQNYDIPLFLDGARLGYGLVAENTDVDLEFLCKVCDVFYIGGTKIGALSGEAIVFTHNNTPKNFVTIIKQHGALLAKGRLLGVQFDTLFTDNLYFRISKNAVEMSELLKKGLKEKGYRFYLKSPTNQQFIILENEKIKELSKNVVFSLWEKYDENNMIVRFATSWATLREDVKKLMELL